MKYSVICLLFILSLGAAAPLLADENRLGRALSYYYGGDHRTAVEALKAVIAEEPDNAAAYYYLGYIYQEMEMFPAARAAFKKTYEINPDFVPAVPGNPASQ